jgi:hypothetical protein
MLPSNHYAITIPVWNIQNDMPMVFIESLIMFLFFIFSGYYFFDNEFVMFYIVLYFSILTYGLIKVLYILFNKK